MTLHIQLYKCNDCYTIAVTVNEKPTYIRTTEDKELAYNLYYKIRELKSTEFEGNDNEIGRMNEDELRYFPGCGMDLYLETIA